MSTPARLAAFAVGLVVAFGAAWGVGDAVVPILDEPAPAQDHRQDQRNDDGHDESDGGGTEHDQ
ncbi:hypothetical protein [Nocardioides sp.]|uniref:hypothetical protein n=1 Tax=Nocardioides sp. TaxID=35761 RepID=UPI002BEBEEF7|nr:hypothetical protein [Nocardioides sp.]HXH80718.1 hypothetical protein [Nocardioides sp.]